MRTLLISIGIVIVVGGCNKRSSQDADRRGEQLVSPAEQADTSTKVDACKLLTPEEIEMLLGEPLKQPVVTYRSESGFAISQCYFGLPTPSKSVVITVTRRGVGQDAEDPREFWMEKFHPETEHHEEAEQDNEGRPRVQPVKIEGVGDEAYWVDAGQMGALYALQGELFIRVAVGGSDAKDVRISKSKKLAEIALKRL
jgi:hypothetical protein